MEIIEDHAGFFTATIYEWRPILKDEKYKRIITDSLSFLSRDGRIFVYAFVIMDSHLHLIWQMRSGHLLPDIQRDFLKYTAQKIRYDLIESHPELLKEFEVNLKDRKYQIWQRNPLSVSVYSKGVIEQKLDYIHYNPVKAGLCGVPEDYTYSSARFYTFGERDFDFLVHYEG